MVQNTKVSLIHQCIRLFIYHEMYFKQLPAMRPLYFCTYLPIQIHSVKIKYFKSALKIKVMSYYFEH